MSKIVFSESAWEEYLCWQSQDKKTLKKINALLKTIQRAPLSGDGKPEPLKGSKNWSRRINDKDRLVYNLEGGYINIIQCKISLYHFISKIRHIAKKTNKNHN